MSDPGPLRVAAAAAAQVTKLAISVVLASWAGAWIDGRLDTAPLFLFLGVLCGAIVGFVQLYRMLITNDDDDSTHDSNPPQ